MAGPFLDNPPEQGPKKPGCTAVLLALASGAVGLIVGLWALALSFLG